MRLEQAKRELAEAESAFAGTPAKVEPEQLAEAMRASAALAASTRGEGNAMVPQDSPAKPAKKEYDINEFQGIIELDDE